MIFYKILLAVFLIMTFHLPAAVHSTPTNPANCTHFGRVKAATKSLEIYSALLYNYQWALETNQTGDTLHSIATNLFDGLRMTAVAGIYSQILLEAQNDPSSQNYTGFGNHNIPGFFGQLLSDVTKDICVWLMSYGPSITERTNVNCSHRAEQLLLSQFSMIMPMITDFKNHFEPQFNCPQTMADDTWVIENLLADYRPEINYLRGLFGWQLL